MERVKGGADNQTQKVSQTQRGQQPKAQLRSCHRTFFWGCCQWCGHQGTLRVVPAGLPMLPLPLDPWWFSYLNFKIQGQTEVWVFDWPSLCDLIIIKMPGGGEEGLCGPFGFYHSRQYFPQNSQRKVLLQVRMFTPWGAKRPKEHEEAKKDLPRRWISFTLLLLRMC